MPTDIAVTYKFFTYPDLRVDHVTFGHIEEVLEFLPDAIIISLGENDITKGCLVNNIVGHILMLVKIFKSAGVQTVFMAEMLETGYFGDWETFRKISSAVYNRVVSSKEVRCYGLRLEGYPRIEFPEHYCKYHVKLDAKGKAK